MAKVICKLENASEEISGVKFEPHPEGIGMVSEEISDEAAASFASITGYELVGENVVDPATQGELDALSARAKELGIKVRGNWKIDRLRTEVETAARAKAEENKEAAAGQAGDGEQK